MNKVTTINLNGRAYQMEEAGYDVLRKYLDEARGQLKDDPDQAEIMADFEQAIADKCDAHLAPRKNVVTAAEIEEIIKAMGPVDAGTHDGSVRHDDTVAGSAGAAGARPKRLYRIIDGSMIRGVCAGLAAYFNIDVTLIRILFVVFTLVSGGGFAVAYLVMMFVTPVARTADEVAQAHGEPPFTAQDFINRAKEEYAKHAADPEQHKEEWRKKIDGWTSDWKDENNHSKDDWRANRRAARAAWREERRRNREMWRAERGTCHGSGAGAIIGGIFMAILWIVFLVAVVSFLAHGIIFGHVVGVGHPIWVTLLFLLLVFWLISLPFKAMMCVSRFGHHHHHHGGVGDVVWTLACLILLFYVASLLFPPVHGAWEHVITYLQTVR